MVPPKSAELPFVATCQAGLEPILANELRALGVDVVSEGVRMVSFHGNDADLYRCNMAARSAMSILKPLKKFNAKNFDILYYQSKKVNWHKLFTVDKSVRIDVKGQSQGLENTKFIIHRIKDGIMDTFRKFNDGQRPYIRKSNADVHIVAYFYKDEVTLYLDSSGAPLFKRGYRVEKGDAPVKEDLAAGILLMSGWEGQAHFFDPMCGSGTFLFEAYMIAARIAPNLERSFAFKHWEDFDAFVFEKEKEKLFAQQVEPEVKFFGIEADRMTADIARSIARTSFAGSDAFDFAFRDFRNEKRQFENSIVVTNPPYGVRIEVPDILKLYNQLGDFFKTNCAGSQVTVFTSHREAAQNMKMKAKKKQKMKNGGIDTSVLIYDIRPKPDA